MPGAGRSRRHAKRKQDHRRLAQSRIAYLLSIYEGLGPICDRDLARRAGTLAYRLSTKYNLTIPRSIKHRKCRGCGELGLPTETRVRLRNGRRILTCHGCGEVRRVPYKPHHGLGPVGPRSGEPL